GLVQAPESDDLYVVDQRGRIDIVRGGSVLTPEFLRVAVDYTSEANERGLLGLAFHPSYPANGRFFVYYTTSDAGGIRNVLAEYRQSANPDVAEPVEVQRLVDLPDSEWNHNGGHIAFGPDGYLYVALGDGGGGGDVGHGPIGNGQNTDSLFGALLRLDVD